MPGKGFRNPVRTASTLLVIRRLVRKIIGQVQSCPAEQRNSKTQHKGHSADGIVMPKCPVEMGASSGLALIQEEACIEVVTVQDMTKHPYHQRWFISQLFGDKFRSPNLQDWEFMDELFILSTKELALDPKIAGEVEEADWVWPERYAAASPMPWRNMGCRCGGPAAELSRC